jgi:pantoate--beta-alanine ligase
MMEVCQALAELRAVRDRLEDPLGLVPTMGFLHEGHLSLVHRAKAKCRTVAVSIYVNPTQFGPGEDLVSYPRDLDRDLDLLRDAGTDLVWAPTDDELYPVGAQSWVTVDGLTKVLEGAHREGHFRGVTTVVAKLFNAFQPQVAYFGQKDAQQVAVIRQMVRDLLFPIEIVVCPTVREPDGLAMSSRNAYLDPEERAAATVLYRSLNAAEAAFQAGERSAVTLKDTMLDVLNSEPVAEIQYVSVADPESLEELDGMVDRALLSMAVCVGTTRLIDNVQIGN